MIVRCTLVLPDDLDVAGRIAEVDIEDVTLADAPARIVAQARIPAAELPRVGRRLGPVELEVAAPPPGRRYAVRAQLQREDRLAAGDLLSTVAIPVAGPGTIDVPLTTV
jgi:uncharacterized lipoprotein YbaY